MMMPKGYSESFILGWQMQGWNTSCLHEFGTLSAGTKLETMDSRINPLLQHVPIAGIVGVPLWYATHVTLDHLLQDLDENVRHATVHFDRQMEKYWETYKKNGGAGQLHCDWQEACRQWDHYQSERIGLQRNWSRLVKDQQHRRNILTLGFSSLFTQRDNFTEEELKQIYTAIEWKDFLEAQVCKAKNLELDKAQLEENLSQIERDIQQREVELKSCQERIRNLKIQDQEQRHSDDQDALNLEHIQSMNSEIETCQMYVEQELDRLQNITNRCSVEKSIIYDTKKQQLDLLEQIYQSPDMNMEQLLIKLQQCKLKSESYARISENQSEKLSKGSIALHGGFGTLVGAGLAVMAPLAIIGTVAATIGTGGIFPIVAAGTTLTLAGVGGVAGGSAGASFGAAYECQIEETRKRFRTLETMLKNGDNTIPKLKELKEEIKKLLGK